MTNQEAIKIIEDMIKSMDDIDVLYDFEKDALNILLKNTQAIEALNEVGNIGYIVSAEDLYKALERK